MILIQDDIWTRRHLKKESAKMSWIVRKVRRRILFVLVVLMAGLLAFEYTRGISPSNEKSDNVVSRNNATTGSLLVDMPFCKIPKVDPYDPTIHHIVRKIGRRRCPQNASLTYQSGLDLKINWTAVRLPPYNGNVMYCAYTPIYRPMHEPTNNNYLRYLDEKDPFNDSIKVEHEFVKVNCYDNNENIVYVNFHAFILPNRTLDKIYNERIIKHVMKEKITERLNVMMIGMDSVSRLSFMRQMVKTKRFLEEELGAFDMMGYNKVADNTFINIVPMTFGKFAQEMPWDESKTSQTFDHFDFMWKQYRDRGYRTFYAEDAPDIAIFDFLKAGFKTPPTDHFNRPISIAMELKENLWFNNHHCFQDRLETDIVLKYMYDFAETYKNDPFFAFTFITRLSHDDVNSAGAADEPYYNFFKSLHEKDLLRNTVVFFFSDHGMRFGKIRETYIGKLEERLPFMYIVIPKWLRKSYPHIPKTLKTNQNRLSTPFDVYETLRDILYFDGKLKVADDNSRGVSFLREIPISRSCDKAGILPHWCTCLHHEKLETNDDVVVKASFVLLSEILNELREYKSICEDLSLHKIREAVRLVESNDVLKFVSGKKLEVKQSTVNHVGNKAIEDIQVVIETVPGNALFEATVRLDTFHESYKVVGDISRINIYGHQSDCIDVFKLKKYCQCKEIDT
ncbi:uncharacterized protein LOC123525542 [Mercenaria mercenaria]|uniref:uncharacterized protein LOC123525542 n=1 Tax=Mercenaria mercenaria TaxID=6596 RepID=UPI001E1D9EDD|nr:uncharacterized protein LOC123525542 [Mercenaria mercenaria]